MKDVKAAEKLPATTLADLFQALSDPTRLRLLNLMAGGEICVCYFVEVLGEPQPKISRHLAHLRRAGLVAARRDGKWIHYRLADADSPARPIIATVLETIARDPQLRRDRERLSSACCAVSLPESLRNAPRPVLGNAP